MIRLQQAIDGVYSPHGGFNQRDLDLAFLVQSIAGPRLLYALQKSHGFASTTTIQPTVVAMASYARSDHYRPVPLIFSPSDKTEKGESLAIWIQTLIDEYNIHVYGKSMHGPIFSIASDGDSSFRKARQILCMKNEIDPSSELGKIVCPLLGMNTWTSLEGITGTCDPKHVFKSTSSLVVSYY